MKGSSPSRLSTSVGTHRQDIANVDFVVHATEGESSAWARALPNHGRERLLLLGGGTRSESLRGGRCVLRRPPTALDFLVFAPRLLIANAEGIVRRPALTREGAAEGERPCPPRIRGGEENAHRTALPAT